MEDSIASIISLAHSVDRKIHSKASVKKTKHTNVTIIQRDEPLATRKRDRVNISTIDPNESHLRFSESLDEDNRPSEVAEAFTLLKTSPEHKKSKKAKKKRKNSDGDQQRTDSLKTHAATSASTNATEDNETSGNIAEVEYPYEVNADDHCETPIVAYKHILLFLDYLSSLLKKPASELRIYDPFFCEGAVIDNMAKLGFQSVYNRKEDFYQMRDNNRIPEFDVLMTNPPYSQDHMERILDYCHSCGKPWLLLVPNYVYTKDYFFKIRARYPLQEVFFVSPMKRYLYTTPKGRRQSKSGKFTAPFPTFWYCSLGDTFKTNNAKPIDQLLLSRKRRPIVDSASSSSSTGDMDDAGNSFIVTLSTSRIPLALLPDSDALKKKERNAKKRFQHKQRKRKDATPPVLIFPG